MPKKGMSAPKIALIYRRSQALNGWGVAEHLGDVGEKRDFRNEWEMFGVG